MEPKQTVETAVTITLEGSGGTVGLAWEKLKSGCDCDASMHDGEADAVHFTMTNQESLGNGNSRLTGTLRFQTEPNTDAYDENEEDEYVMTMLI